MTTTPDSAIANAASTAPRMSLSDVQLAITHTGDWLRVHALDIAVAAGAGAIIYLVLRYARRWIRKAAQRQADHLSIGATLLRVLARTRHAFMVLAAIRLVVGVANPPAVVSNVIGLIFIVGFALQAAIWARELILDLVRMRVAAGASETLGNAMSLINILVSVALFAIAAIVILDNVGVNVTGLIAGLGIGGIAIGLAAQGIFSDLFAALSIIFDRPFRIGDSITYDTTTATVERIGLKSTRLRSVNGQQIIMSNTNLLNKEINNFTQLTRRRINLPIGLVYQTPPEALQRFPALVQQVIEASGHHFIRAGFINFGASSLDFECIFDVESDDFATVQRARNAVGLALYDAIRGNGLSLAYPTQTTFTADPVGAMIMPYHVPDSAKAGPTETTGGEPPSA
jgi:small-conductance mechanosensitive channel